MDEDEEGEDDDEDGGEGGGRMSSTLIGPVSAAIKLNARRSNKRIIIKRPRHLVFFFYRVCFVVTEFFCFTVLLPFSTGFFSYFYPVVVGVVLPSFFLLTSSCFRDVFLCAIFNFLLLPSFPTFSCAFDYLFVSFLINVEPN